MTKEWGGVPSAHLIGVMTSGILRGIEVNRNTGIIAGESEILHVSHEAEREQVRVLADRKAGCDQAAVDAGSSGCSRSPAARAT